LTPDVVPRMLRDSLQLQERQAGPRAERFAARRTGAPENGDGEIRIGLGSCCVARGSGRVYEALQKAVNETGVSATLKPVGCFGMSHLTPLVEVLLPVDRGRGLARSVLRRTKSPERPSGASVLYALVRPGDAKSIVLRHFRPKGVARKVAVAVSNVLENILTDEAWEPVARYSIDVRDPQIAAFVGRQKHIATEHCGQLDPLDLDEYLQHDGFKALKRCLDELTPEDVIAQVTESGLRGRGGAGYPTGQKWADVRASRSDEKFVICNGDEGDPGAFMDRMLLESYPYRIIEGIAIAAYAVGASEGHLYVRAEYPLAVRRIREAIAVCEHRGFLGEEILGGLRLRSGRPESYRRGGDFHFRLKVMRGAGAFVCGEETGLIAALEGRRGMPRYRPPFPAESGLWGKPTLVNNVETFAVVPWIMRNGAAEFAALGTLASKGAKVFALAGKVVRGGLIEVPMGISISEIVEEIGGGIADGKQFKAVQIGGPSGGCVPAELADTPVDYEALRHVGAIMGSGGMVVLDESDCMVDIARYFLEFTQNQSCGKCTFCRIGTRRMLDIMNRLCTGEGKRGDLEELEQLSLMVKKGSLCGLGRTAPNPVLTTLRYFRDEYEAHLKGRCPAHICKALITYSITDDCIGCTRCAQHCPAEAIHMNPYEKHEIDTEKCIRCGTCKQVCPADAVKVE